MATFLQPTCQEGLAAGQRADSCVARAEPWVLAATIIGSSMVFIDSTVVNVALPVLQRELNATAAQMQWVVEAYLLLLASLILVGGALGDHFGRRRIFALGVALFAGASMACGLAPTSEWLIAFRALQGVGGALLAPTSLAIISATFPEERRGRAIGTWSAFTAITMALGPVLGGVLVEQASWRWVFFLNLPLALVVLAITARHVPESRDERAAGLDWRGATLVAVGFGCLVYGLIESANLGLTHPTVLAALTFGVLTLGAFLWVEATSPSPMIPLGLFRSRVFSGANLLTFLLYGGLAAGFFFLPFNLIQVQGYTPSAAGLALLPLMVIIFALSRWSGGLVDRIGPRWPLVIGPTIAGAGAFLYTLPEVGGSYWTTFFPAIVLQGIGMAITAAPLTTVVMGSVESRHGGLAAGINSAVSETGGLLAVAVLGVVALAAFNAQIDARLESGILALPSEAVHALEGERVRLAAAEVPPGLTSHAASELRQAIAQSFVGAFRLVFGIVAMMAWAAAASAWVLIPSRARAPRAAPVEALGHA